MYKQIAFLVIISICKAQISVIREWNYLDYEWSNSDVKQNAINRGVYIPENIVIAGVSYYNNEYYLTLPRMHDGIPATLAKISASGNNTAPLLTAFPSWSMNTISDCNAIQNVQNIEIDSKGRLWIIDVGRVATLSKIPIIKCFPKLLIYDLKQNKIIMTYTFPPEVAHRETSYLYDLVIDETDNDASYAYITDNSGRDPGIIVFSLKYFDSWKIRHSPTMRAQKEAINFQVDGTLMNIPINIAGIALGPKSNSTTDRMVYYSPISSFHLYAINSSALKNITNSKTEFMGEIYDLGMKQSQTDGMIMDNKGVLYFGLIGMSGLAKWDSNRKPFATGQKVIAKDPKYIQWPNSFTFDNKGNIICLVNKLQKFVHNTMNINEENFRLLSWNTSSYSYVYDRYKYTVETDTASSITTTMKITTPEEDGTETTINGIQNSSTEMNPKKVYINEVASLGNMLGGTIAMSFVIFVNLFIV